LLVVIVVFSIAVLAINVPRMNKAHQLAKATQACNEGKQVYILFFCRETGEPSFTLFPERYFKWPTGETVARMGTNRSSSLVLAELLKRLDDEEEYAFLTIAGRDIPKAGSRSELVGGHLHNQWCITLDYSEKMAAKTPVIFTQNFKFKTRRPDATLNQMVGLESTALPFGDNAGIVIQRGGAGIILDAQTATQTNFNPTGATNGFLWPLASGQDLAR
jgi:hypothetical protein